MVATTRDLTVAAVGAIGGLELKDWNLLASITCYLFTALYMLIRALAILKDKSKAKTE